MRTYVKNFREFVNESVNITEGKIEIDDLISQIKDGASKGTLDTEDGKKINWEISLAWSEAEEEKTEEPKGEEGAEETPAEEPAPEEPQA